MIWSLSWRADPTARVIADRHYNRQSVGAAQFVPPGRCLVLSHPLALWVTSWPLWVKHRWPGAWVCSAFRNEGAGLSSALIRDAVAATRWRWPAVPALGMITFVDAGKVRRKRDPGRCFLRAGFTEDGTTEGGLLAFRMPPEDMPEAQEPLGAQRTLDFADHSPAVRHADPEKAKGPQPSGALELFVELSGIEPLAS